MDSAGAFCDDSPFCGTRTVFSSRTIVFAFCFAGLIIPLSFSVGFGLHEEILESRIYKRPIEHLQLAIWGASHGGSERIFEFSPMSLQRSGALAR